MCTLWGKWNFSPFHPSKLEKRLLSYMQICSDLDQICSDLDFILFRLCSDLIRFCSDLIGNFLDFVQICSDLDQIWINLNKSDQIWTKSDQNLIKHLIKSDLNKYEQIWTNLIKIWRNMNKAEQIWSVGLLTLVLPIPRMYSSLESPATEEALRRNIGTV